MPECECPIEWLDDLRNVSDGTYDHVLMGRLIDMADLWLLEWATDIDHPTHFPRITDWGRSELARLEAQHGEE